MKPVVLFSLCILSVAGTGSQSLQAQRLGDTLRIREVSVTGRGQKDDFIPGSEDFDSLTLAGSRTASLSSLLSHHSGIYIRETGRGTLATASFRGSDGSHTRVYWNGLELNSAMNGQVDLSLVPVFFLDRVRICRGGASLRQGSGALGGSIVTENRPDWSVKHSGSFMQEFGSFGTTATRIGGSLTSGRWLFETRSYRLYSRNDFPFMDRTVLPASEERVRNASYRQDGLLQDVYFRNGHKGLFSLHLWVDRSGRNLPALPGYEGSRREERQVDRALRFTMGWDRYYDKGEFRLRSGLALQGLDYFLRSADYDYVHFDSGNRETRANWVVGQSHRFSSSLSMESRVSLVLDHASNQERVSGNGYTGQQHRISLMSALRKKAGHHLDLSFLLREEAVTGHLTRPMPAAGVEYRIPAIKGLSVSANLSRNYKEPDLNELYWIPGGNKELEPEEGTSSELSLNFRRNGSGCPTVLRLGGFYSDIANWILWKPTPYRYWSASNVRRVVSRGVELRLQTGWAAAGWQCRLNASCTHALATNESPQGTGDNSLHRQLPYLPEYSGNMEARISNAGWFFDYQLVFSGKRFTQSAYAGDGPEIILNPYVLNDLEAGIQMKLFAGEFILKGAVRNLGGTEYMLLYSRPMPGRNYSLILEYRF